MKKATTEMAAAIRVQASEVHNANDDAKVQKFIDMCKSLRKISRETPKKTSIRKGRMALILMEESYQGDSAFLMYRMEREFYGRIVEIGFSPDSIHQPIITMEGCESVVRCYEGGDLMASSMEKAGRVILPINHILSITYII